MQCDQIGQFLQVTNMLAKVPQIFGDFWGYFKKHYLLSKIRGLIFGQLLGKFGLFFIPACGHTTVDVSLKRY